MMTEAREFWWKTRDSKESLTKFPKYAYIERNILQGLVDRGSNDYMGAFNKVVI
jgi:tRNA(Glu) U13 pseudouridine synthase TruD